MNALQVKVDCGEGNKGGLLSECLRVTTAYLSTKIEDSKWESLRAGMAGPSRTQSSGHKGHATGEAWHEVKEGGKILINLITAYGLVIGQCTNYIL